jgi:signal transduction histidine kinase
MRKALYTIIFLVWTLSAKAQLEKIDSLLRELPSAKEDTNKVLLLLKIVDAYDTNNLDSATYYLEELKRLSDLLRYKLGIYKYYERSLIISFTKGNYTLAMQHSDHALQKAREMADTKLITNTLVNTAIVYQYLGQFDKQLEYCLEALRLMESVDQKEKLSNMYSNIGNAYYNLHQFRRSIQNNKLSLRHHKPSGSNTSYNRVYASLGQNYAMLKDTDSALYYYKIALVESGKIKDKIAEAGIYGFMANTYADRNEFREMLKVSDASLVISRQLQSNQMLASSLYNVAYANYFNGDNTSAKKNIYEALALAKSDMMQDELKNIYTVLSYIAAREGDFKISLWAMQKKDSIQDALLSEKVINTTGELETKYETEKKNEQIVLQRAQIRSRNILNYMLAGLVVTASIISLLSYRNYRQKQRLQQLRISELETEKQLGSTEAVLKGEEQERTRLAKDLHDGLGGMLSGIKYSLNAMKGNLIMTPDNHQAFERSMDMLDSSIKEMRRVAHNMMPEALVRFGLDTALRDYCNDLNQGGALQINYQSIGLADYNPDQTAAINIYRIVQELIGNTLKHAASKTAIVQVTKTDKLLAVTVEDDGKGFDPGLLEQSKGIGWTNIQHRVDFLKGRLDIRSTPGKGTSVHIEFNI